MVDPIGCGLYVADPSVVDVLEILVADNRIHCK